MNTNKQIDSIIDEIADNPAEVKQALGCIRAESALVQSMIDARHDAGYSQRELARRSGLSAAKICRMESGDDSSLRMADIKAYLAGIGYTMNIMLDNESLDVALRIKQHVMSVGRELEKLSALAQQDPSDRMLVDGITKFRGEVLFNFMIRYAGTQPPIQIAPKQEPKSTAPRDRKISSIAAVR